VRACRSRYTWIADGDDVRLVSGWGRPARGASLATSRSLAACRPLRGPQYALDRSPNLGGFPSNTADVITAVFIP
jgi:hypothetical protein